MKIAIRKYLLWGLLGAIVIVGLQNCGAIRYGLRQGVGQARFLLAAEDLAKVKASGRLTPRQLERLALIDKIKRFTVDSLGLLPSKSYTTYYDQQGKPIMWMMTASEPYRIKAFEWHFPIVGTFTYKGHFKKAIAEEELAELGSRGYDTRLSEVAAWSTLGYLKDPILSSMLNKSEGQLAALLIHELTHGTLYIKNNVGFNENLADFIGDYGALRFLAAEFGTDSKQYQQYIEEKRYESEFSQHMVRGSRWLDTQYQSAKFLQASTAQKDTLKSGWLQQIIISSDTLTTPAAWGQQKPWRPKKINNAYFISFINYQSKQNEFETEFREKFGSDFKKYMTWLKSHYSSL